MTCTAGLLWHTDMSYHPLFFSPSDLTIAVLSVHPCGFSMSILWHYFVNTRVLPCLVVRATPILQPREPVCCCCLNSPSMVETVSWITPTSSLPHRIPEIHQEDNLKKWITALRSSSVVFLSVLGNIMIILLVFYSQIGVPCSKTGSTFICIVNQPVKSDLFCETKPLLMDTFDVISIWKRTSMFFFPSSLLPTICCVFTQIRHENSSTAIFDIEGQLSSKKYPAVIIDQFKDHSAVSVTFSCQVEQNPFLFSSHHRQRGAKTLSSLLGNIKII